MRKRVLALVLALTLVVSGFSETVFAAETGSENSSGSVPLSKMDYTGSDPSSASGTDVTFSVPATTDYDITGGFTGISADAATASQHQGGPGGGSSSVTLSLSVKDSGGTVLCKKEDVTLSSTAQSVNFDWSKDSQLSKAAVLEIKLVSSSTDSFGPSPSVEFTNAEMSIDPSAGEKLKKVTLTADTPFLDSGATSDTTVAGKLYNGSDVTSGDLTVTYQSSNEKVATVSGDGTITAVGNGTAGITATACLNADQADSSKKTKTSTTYVVVGSGLGNNSPSWMTVSPSSKVKLLFFLGIDGSLRYAVFSGSKAVVGISPAGMKTSVGDYTSGLQYDTESSKTIDESYNMISGKQSVYYNKANETTLTFSKTNSPDLSIVTRAYDDGFAFRYSINNRDKFSISSESTGYQVPDNSYCYHMSYVNSYEGKYYGSNISDVSGSQAVPFLYQTGTTNVLLMEAALSGSYSDYAGIMLKPDTNRSGLMDVSYTAEQSGDITTSSGSFVSPWRCAVIGSYSDIVGTQMFENLNETYDPSNFSDGTSWITPGATTWTWLNGSGCSDGDVYKKYIDLSAEMGWKYVLLDEGWQPKVNGSYSGYYSWFKDVCTYAAQKGIGLLVWTNCSLVNSSDPTNADYVGKIAKWVEASKVTVNGKTVQAIKGIKADFFNSESQSMMKTYALISEECAKDHLIVNYHGANKPTGERRNMPNVIAREGIYGNEHSDVSAEQNCLLPFTRCATGPADYTPLLYDDGSDLVSTNQLSALAVLFECGIPCFADAKENYEASNLFSWFKNMPATWTQTKLLDADLGSYIAEARKSRDADIQNGSAEWYASAICTNARDAKFDLSFLDSNKTYYAWIYQDGDTNNDCFVSCKTVTSADTLTIPMRENGGCNVKFTTTKPSSSSTIQLSAGTENMEVGNTCKLTATLGQAKANLDYNSVNWTSSNKNVATVCNGKITATGLGTATITASTGLQDNVSAACTINVTASSYKLTSNWTADSGAAYGINSEKSLSLTTQNGNWKPMGGDSTDKNIVTTDATGDFTASVKLTYKSSTSTLPAGLMIRNDGTTVTSSSSGGGMGGPGGGSSTPYIALLRGTTATSASSNADDASGVNVTTVTKTTANTITLKNGSTTIVMTDPYADTTAIYLKIERTRNVSTGYVSKDNANWIQVTDGTNSSITSSDLNDTTGVGVATTNGSGRYDNVAALFENFTLNGNVSAFAQSLSNNNSSGDNENSSGNSSSGKSETSTESSTVSVGRTPAGAPTVAVTTVPDAAPVISGNTASFGVTVAPDILKEAAVTGTAAQHAQIVISIPDQTIIGQLTNSDVSTVQMSMTLPSDVAYSSASNADITINMDAVVLQAAKQAQKDITVNVIDSTSGKVAYSWTFRGAELESSGTELKDINMAMNTRTTALDASVSNAVPSANKGVLLTFANSGELPAPATVRVLVSDQGYRAGQTLYLYYYNSFSKQLETVDNSTCTVDSNGYATIVINHCSQYVLLPQQVAAAAPIKLDTGSKLSVKVGKTYQFKVTSAVKPTFLSGNNAVFQVTYNGHQGNSYFFKVTAIGKADQAVGFYLNQEKKPRTIASIIK